MKRTLTCIVCPLGCTLTAELDGKTVVSVEGNTCPRGKDYAVTECTSPMRTVTSTVKCDDGGLVAVKTSVPIPKEKMFDCIKIINNALAHLPIHIGDVIIKDVYGSDIIAAQESEFIMNTGTVIAALRSDKDFENAIKSAPSVIFDLAPDINSLKEKLDRAHSAGKRYFIHMDLAVGIGKDESGILFLKSLGVDGIISTRINIIKTAREHGIFTVQRFFIVDSHSITTTFESLKASKADMIEIMPGILPRVIRSLREKIDIPIIAGGLIESEDDLQNVLDAGATAVSTSRTELWNI